MALIPNLITFIIIIIIGSIIADFVGNWAQKELPAGGVPGGRGIGLGAEGILHAIVFVTAITQLQVADIQDRSIIQEKIWRLSALIVLA